jgi:O-antigen/teichoic acid export membrane protein
MTRVTALAKGAHGLKAPPLSLRGNFMWTFLGNVVYSGCQWGMLTAIAKLGTPTMLGQFSLALAITAPVYMLLNLELRTVQATDIHDEHSFGDYLGLRIITTVLATVVTFCIVLASGYASETSFLILMLALAKAPEALSDLAYGQFQKHSRMDRIGSSLVIKGFASLGGFATAFVLKSSLLWATASLLVIWTALFLFYDLPNLRALLPQESREAWSIRPQWNTQSLSKLVMISIPLGMVIMLNSLNINIPRYFVEHFHGEASLGYFSASAYFLLVGGTIVNALSQSALPSLAKHYQNDRKSFILLILKLLLINFSIGGISILVAYWWGEPILSFLYTKDYATHTNILTMIMVAGAIQYCATVAGCGLTAARCFRLQTILTMAVTIATFFSSFWLASGGDLESMGLAYIPGSIMKLVISFLAIRYITSHGGTSNGGLQTRIA